MSTSAKTRSAPIEPDLPPTPTPEPEIVATADDYREKVSRPKVKVSTGLVFQLRNMEFPEFVKISDKLKEDFELGEGGVFSMAVDQKRPELMYTYAELVLPLVVIQPAVIPKQKFDKNGKPKRPKFIGVNELAPMDVFRLNSASLMGKSEVLEMMASFRPGEPVGEGLGGDSDKDGEETE